MPVIPAGNPSLWTGPTGNNTYLLPGTVSTLIDAGVGHPTHLRAVEEHLQEQPLGVILITHAHPDHTQGIPALVERWPAAVVRNYPPDACRHDEVLPAGDTWLRAIFTPGHAPDHFCFLDESTGDLYCGDLARQGGTVVIPDSAGGNLVDYLESLRRVRELAPRRLLPGHGPIVEEPLALIDGYLRHRAEREQQIIGALRGGCTSPEEIVARVYGPMPSPLVRAAADSVRSHLRKLAAEHVAAQTGEGWHLA